jgi:predicted transcriptional regulator
LDTKAGILGEYKVKLAGWKDRSQPVPDLQKLTVKDATMFVLGLHPTQRKQSKELTINLLKLLAESEILSLEEIEVKLNSTYPPLAKRLTAMRQYGMARREKKFYYLATPRLLEFIKEYMVLLE